MNITTQNSTLSSLSCLFVETSFENNSHIYGALVFSSVLNCILALTASFFNVLVLLTIWGKASLHTPSNILIACLAVSDLGVGVLVQPVCAVYAIVHLQRNPLIYCILGMLSEGLGLLLTGGSLLTLTAISVEKYLAISLHLRYKQIVTVSRTKKAIFLLWIIPVCCFLYRFFYENFKRLMTLGITVISLCMSVIFFCNFRIGRALRRLTIHLSHNPADNTTQSVSNAMGIVRFKKSFLTLLLIIGLFVLCFVPYGMSMVIALKFVFPVWVRRISFITFPIVFLNSTLNPLLYWWRLSELRSATFETVLSLWNNYACKKNLESRQKQTKPTELVRRNSHERPRTQKN